MFLKNCQNLFSFASLRVAKCSLTFEVGYLIKRGAYFESREELISKLEEIIIQPESTVSNEANFMPSKKNFITGQSKV